MQLRWYESESLVSSDDVAEMDRQMIANHFNASSSLAVISKFV